ncbi:hypothetical protein TVAGG3_0526640 [Trichomonas vaginalis G3]|uniref:hypothetical protein n=1 Tax=Trichomonas vaginalis (strain ATCC PRA-98 / G3) TaxID=412133 RepID=UPI0021E57F4B|nr:hypothetical protein TVAGG3_0526640 [Trichomonas vaginalis G3]KAI5518823.1 hypothetical protein TVAGG3_0526640 [Trichomonas vaginalis G3]
MTSQTSLSRLIQLVEEQKLDAINGTVHVWADPSSQQQVRQATTKIGSIIHDPSYFTIHKIVPNRPQNDIAQEMAQCFPRIIVCALCNTQYEDPRRWVNEVYPTYIDKIPYAEFYWCNVQIANEIEREFLDKNQILANPTVVVFKMGHLIDKFVPSIYEAAQEVVELTNPLLPSEGPKRDLGDVLAKTSAGYDPGRAAFEEREYKKKVAEEQNKRIQELLERKCIKEKIAAQRTTILPI